MNKESIVEEEGEVAAEMGAYLPGRARATDKPPARRRGSESPTSAVSPHTATRKSEGTLSPCSLLADRK